MRDSLQDKTSATSALFHRLRLSMTAFLALFVLLCMSSAIASTYYVSNSGNDSAAGTSQATAWQTVAKVNTFALQPGDQVLFQCGGKWYESLNPQSSGAAGNPITFATYGTGNKPLFSGSLTLPNAGFSYVGSNVWQLSVSSVITEVYINKVGMIPANPNANQQVAAIPNSFYWSNGVLQINVPTNPNTDGNLYEGAVRQDIIANGNSGGYFSTSHLVFSNLAEEESGEINNGYGVRIQNGVDVTLNNIESYRCGKHNFGVINSTQVTLNGCLAEYPMPGEQPYGGYTAYVSYGDNSTNLPHQTSVYNNCVGDHMEDTTPNQQYQDTNYEFFTSHGANLGSVLLNNCQALSTSGGGAGAHWTINNAESGATMQIHGGYQANNQLVMTGNNLLVDGLTMQGPGPNGTNGATATIDMECTNSTVQNVLMENLNIGYFLYQAAIQDNNNGNTIRFNTIVNDPSSYDNSIVNHDNSESLYGNLFINPGTAVSGNTPNTNLDNLTYTSTAGAGFVNPSVNNYTLTASSPARDVVPLSLAYPPTDNLGTGRPDGSANDAGAYTYGSGGPNPAPAITSSTTASGTIGTPFSYQITASNGPTSYGETGTLPAGLTFNAATGVISGTPTAAGSNSVTISATNSGGTGKATLAITITTPAPPVINSATTAAGTVGAPFSYQITATNSPASYGETGTLPAGLTFNAATGVISGTPTTVGSSSVTLTASNAGGSGSSTLTITISNPAPTAYNVWALWNPGSTVTNGGADSYGNAYNASLVGTTVTYNGTTLTLGPANAADAFSSVTVNLPAGTYTKLNMIGAAVGGTVTNQPFVVNYIDGTTQTFTQSLSDWGSTQGYATETTVNMQTTRLASNGTSASASTYIYGYTFTLNGKSVRSITLPNTRQVIAFGFTTGGSAASQPAITSATSATGTVGTAFSYQITASGSPTSFNATGLPAGLSVSTSTGLISGTPTAAGTSTVTLSATNASGTGTATLTLTVNPAAPAETPYGGTAWPIPGKVEAENYDVGGEGVAYHDNDPQNIGGAYRSDGVDIRAVASDAGGGYQVGWTNQGEYLNYTVNVAATGSYQFQARVSAGSTGGSLHFNVDGTNVTGPITVPGTGSYDTFTTISSGTLSLTAGKHIIELYEDADNGYDINWFSVSAVAPPAPVINSASSASGTVGTAFSYQITATNSPTSFNATGLPAGLSVNTSTGLISGTPTAAGTSTVTLSAANAGGTGTATLTITVSAAVTTPYGVYAFWNPGSTITNGGADSYGNGYNVSLVGKTVSYNGTTLTLGPANAADAWTSQVVSLPAGTYTTLNMIASADGGTVTGQPFIVTYTDNTTQTFTQNLSDWGSTQGYAGETVVNSQTTRLASNGTSASVPTFIYGYTFTLNGKAAKTITLPNTRQVIAFGFTTGSGAPAKPAITSATSASGSVSKAFSYQITASGSPTSFNATGLPVGLSVNTSTGLISGTPTAAGTSTVTLSAANAVGTGSATLTLTVAAASTPYNVWAFWTPGSTLTNGAADSYGNGYNANLVGSTLTYDGSSFALGASNVADAWSSVTVTLPSGTYTKLDMLGTAVGGTVTNQTFVVNYGDGTSQTFTQNLSDWVAAQGYATETTVNSEPTRLTSTGASSTPSTTIYGYTFALNGKSVTSITLPNTRQVVAFGFAGHN